MEQEESSPAFAYLFIPSLPSHLSHMLVASFETTAFAVAGITFWFFRIMIAIGFLYFLVMMWAGLLWRKKTIIPFPTFFVDPGGPSTSGVHRY